MNEFDPQIREVPTAHGPARVHVHRPRTQPARSSPGLRGALVLGHGAGGSIDAPDLRAVTAAALELRLTVALVEQPYRVAGRRSAAPAPQLDTAWLATIDALRARELRGLPLVAGGRSSGARVACRTAAAAGAAGVLCLAFPLEPPRRDPSQPPKSRLDELRAPSVPVLVVQGENDRFGIPPRGRGRRVVVVPGDHALKRDTAAVAAAARRWLRELLGPAA